MADHADRSFAAFVSYSSKDKRIARRLHGVFERFRIPRRLGSFNLAGRYNRIAPVFRDREELASGDLSSQILGALDSSSALVVVCSPNSANSVWVDREISRFIELGRSDRIFAFIEDGEPNASTVDRECFPPALRNSGAQVLAGDRRKGGDGFRDAALKVIAGILRVPFADLKRREREEQVRNTLMYGAPVALALGIALIITSVTAGFRGELMESVVTAAPHMTGYSDGESYERDEMASVAAQARVVSPYVQTTVLASANGRTIGIEAIGASQAYFDDILSAQSRRLVQLGRPQPAPIRVSNGEVPEVAIGQTLAYDLRVAPGDQINLHSSEGALSGSVAGVFAFNNAQYDNWVLMDLAAARTLSPSMQSMLAVRVDDPLAIEEAKAQIESIDDNRRWQTWQERSGGYFTALSIEDVVMRVILGSVIALLALNCAFYAPLATPPIAVAVGMIGSFLVALFFRPLQKAIERLGNFQLFPPEMYLMDALPADWRIENAGYGLIACAIGFVAGYLIRISVIGLDSLGDALVRRKIMTAHRGRPKQA